VQSRPSAEPPGQPTAGPLAGSASHDDGNDAQAARPSVKDVARLAGVSVGTVSNVLNRPERVSSEVRLRVEGAIEQLDYVRNGAAQALRSGLAPFVGVAVLDIGNPFFTEAAVGMERRLREDGMVMILSSTHADVREENAILRLFEAQGVRGVLLTPAGTDVAAARELAARGMPVVLFDSAARPQGISSISVDDRLGARLAVEHLLDLGHRRIAFLNGPSAIRQSRDRLAGVQEAVSDLSRGRVNLMLVSLPGYTVSAGHDGLRRLLARQEERPTGVFCANDLIAFGAITALSEAGLSVPGDVSVIGFDDVALAGQLSVPLTTVRQPMDELGWHAVELLFDRSGGHRHERFPPELVVRASTGPVPGSAE